MAEAVESTIKMRNNFGSTHHHRYTLVDSLMRYAEILGFGEVHIKIDQATGLKAIVAIHNLTRGPAIGGCRMFSYQSSDKGIEDALRLGYMMSLKAAINNLPHGGAKAVLIKPKVIKDREKYFEKFGEFVQDLGGRYITAVDSGTSPSDMDIIARKTSFVTCTTIQGGGNDPSPLTALGVRRGIEAAVHFKLNRNLEGITVAIQGAGHVGYYLAKELTALGARIIMADINPKSIEKCVAEMGVLTCPPEEIYEVEADVFSPCALGAVLNLPNIKKLKAKIVAGSANNQLAHHHYGAVLHERGILYAPDFLINAGGLIQVAVVYDHGDLQQSLEQINDIYDRAMEIFQRAKQENKATNTIAEEIAWEKLR